MNDAVGHQGSQLTTYRKVAVQLKHCERREAKERQEVEKLERNETSTAAPLATPYSVEPPECYKREPCYR